MWFDTATAVFIHGAIDILLCLAALYTWKVSARLPCTWYWSVGLFAFWIGHGSMFFYYMPTVVRGGLIWSLLPALGYIAHAAGLTALAKGSELLLGFSVKAWWSWPLIILGFVGGGLFTIVFPSDHARIVVGNLIYSGLAIRGFAAFWHKTSQDWNPGITGRLAGLQFLLIALLDMGHAVSAMLNFYGSVLFTRGLFNSIHAITIVALVLTLSQLVYKRLNDDIHVKIHENDLLVKELHHRTKNNLALVASILSLEGAQQKERAAREAFENVRSRVLALSALYERLQHGATSVDVDLGEYLRDIANGICSSIGRNGVTLIADELIEGTLVPLGSAIPLGLIANELITNALKHAFPADGGLISLRLKSIEGGLALIVEDSGIGIQEVADGSLKDIRQGLGSTIVASLVQQLEGTIQLFYPENGGTLAELRVPTCVLAGSCGAPSA